MLIVTKCKQYETLDIAGGVAVYQLSTKDANNATTKSAGKGKRNNS